MKIELKVQTDRMTEVVLSLELEEKTALVKKLSNLDPMDETKIQAGSTTIFFKLRDTDSRVLISHPEPDEWVVTVALETAYMKTLIQKLGLDSGFKLVSFVPANRVNNAALTLS